MISHNALLIVGFEVLIAVVMNSSIVWDMMPRSPLKVDWYCTGKCGFHLRAEKRAKKETNMKEAAREVKNFSETSVDFQRTTWCYVSKDRTLHAS
jgi:hypothetical protein